MALTAFRMVKEGGLGGRKWEGKGAALGGARERERESERERNR